VYSHHAFVQGFTSVSDLIRGVVQDDKDIITEVELHEFFPASVMQEIKTTFQSDDFSSNFSEYLNIKFGVSSQFATSGIKNKILMKNEFDLTDYECVQIFLKLMKVDLFFSKTDLVDRLTNTHYNIIFCNKQALLCAYGTLILINGKRFSAFDTRSMVKIGFVKGEEGREVCVGYISDRDYLKVLRNNFHITWHRPARFREAIG